MAFWGRKESTCFLPQAPSPVTRVFQWGADETKLCPGSSFKQGIGASQGCLEGCSRGEHAKRKTGGRGWGQNFGPLCHLNPSSSVCAQGFFCTGVLLLATKANKKLLQPSMKKCKPSLLIVVCKGEAPSPRHSVSQGAFLRSFVHFYGLLATGQAKWSQGWSWTPPLRKVTCRILSDECFHRRKFIRV